MTWMWCGGDYHAGREDLERGYKGAAAVSKKAVRKGKEIAGMDGWIDMEASDDDKKKPFDDDDEDEDEEED